jgi:hypothetical protein
MVIVHTSKVLSPAILRFLPLNGTSITPTVDAGKFAVLIINLESSLTDLVLSVTLSPTVVLEVENVGKLISHSKRFGLAAPPINLALKSSSVLELKLGVFENVICFYLDRD